MTEVCTIPVPELESREELPHVLNNVDEGEHDLGAFSAELLNEIQHFDKQKRLSGKFEFHIAVQHKAEEKDEEVSHTDYPQDDVNDDVSLRRVITESLSFPHFSAELLEEIQHFNRDQQKIQSKNLKLPIVLKRKEVLSSTGHPLASYNINVATATYNIVTTNTHPTPSSTDWVCAICLDSLPEKNPNSISCLTCQFCVPCLFEYVKIQIEEKTPHMTAHWTIRCPCLMEGCELSTANVEQCINGETDELKRGILLAKFHRFAQDLEVQHDSRKVFCPQRDCSAVVALPSKFNIFSFGRAKCQDCKHSFCSKCNNNHNRFLGCDSVSEYQFRMWRLSTRQGCKKCPGCKIYIEKNQGCSHMTCRACGTHFCWHCLRKNHGDSVYCKVLSALDSEEWGESTATRAVTKTLAVPGGLVVGGLAIGAVGVAAGLAVAGGAVALCASPAIFGYKYYRDRRSLALAATHLQHIRQEHILQHGIVFVLPSHMEYSYSWRVDKLLENMAGVSVPAPASNGNMPPPFRVAYTDYVLYFSPTPYAVPGFEEDDFPFTEGSNDTTTDTIFYINRYGERVDGVRPYLTPRRAYIQLSSDFVKGISAHGSESEARSGEQLSTALQDVFEQASRRTEDVVTI
mmetsp:Transcript_4348/g.8049  ORF Transcript_4348/g.8049 Transcript_4348/m.8049 type:complete len:629 (+) Transcript_4348:38-1924(+)